MPVPRDGYSPYRSSSCRGGKYALVGFGLLFIWLFVVLPALAGSTPESAGTEFWPSFFGYRLKITDTLVAVFTAALFFATWLLWQATKNLVMGAEQTAERQLRAYVYFKETKVDFAAWKIAYRIDNFGQTPAHKVRLLTIAKVVDWVDGKPAAIPIPDRVETIGSMAPNGDFFEFEIDIEGIATEDEIKQGTKAIYLTGNIVYQTVFDRALRVTNFRYYIGGDQGYETEMLADSLGNDAT
jgi:hypothetical protein